jgi:hypothetical protein
MPEQRQIGEKYWGVCWKWGFYPNPLPKDSAVSLSSNSQAGHRTAPTKRADQTATVRLHGWCALVDQGLPGHAHRSRHSHTAESPLATISARSSTKLSAKLI